MAETGECSRDVVLAKPVTRSASRAIATRRQPGDDDDESHLSHNKASNKGESQVASGEKRKVKGKDQGKGNDNAKGKGKGKAKTNVAEVEEDNEGNYVVMRSSPVVIFEAIQNMPESMKQRLQQIGFGSLLGFSIDKLLVRSLAMFLMTCVKEKPLRIEVSGRSLPITPEAVHKAFGLPIGGQSVPVYKRTTLMEGRKAIQQICEDSGMFEFFFFSLKKIPSLGLFEVPRFFIEALLSFSDLSSPEEVGWAVKFFLILCCNALFFPTGSDKIGGFDYLMCEDLDSVGSYNWCEAIVHDIQDKAGKWRKQNPHKKTPILQGCIIFLCVYYLDNLEYEPYVDIPRLPEPRCNVFTSGLIETIARHHRIYMDDGSVSYGSLNWKRGCDTVYGRAHEIEEEEPDGDVAGHRAPGPSVCARGMAAKGGGTSKQKQKRLVTRQMPYGLIKLELALSAVIDSVCQGKHKVEACRILEEYDQVVMRAANGIVENERVIKEAHCAIDQQFSEIKKAQKKLVSEMNF